MMTAYDSAGTDGGAWLYICQSHMHTLLYSSVQLTDCLSAGKELSGQNLNSSGQLRALYTYIIPLLERLCVCKYIYMAVYPEGAW